MSEEKNQDALAVFKSKCREYLDSLDIGALRAYARYIGVVNPTKLKKSNLLVATIGVLSAEIDPIPRSSRGAPIKSGYFSPEIEKTIGEFEFEYLQNGKQENLLMRIRLKHREWSKMVLHFADPISEPRVQELIRQEKTYTGQVVRAQDFYRFFDLESKKMSQSWLLPKDFGIKYGLRDGDVVVCKASTNNSVLIPSIVESINGLSPNALKRRRFEEMEVMQPMKPLHFSNEICRASEAVKYVEWITPPCKGQRVAVVAKPKTGKSRLLFSLVQEMQKSSESGSRVKPFVLLVDQTPETLIRYQKLLPVEQFSYSSYEDEPEKQVAIANLALERVKRYAECGYDVVLFVDSFNALARAYNDTKYSEGGRIVVGDLESKTLQFLKRYFAVGRAFANGSVTVIGAVSHGTGNEVDDVLAAELAGWANMEWRLSDEFINGQIFPVFDLPNSKSSSLYLELEDDDFISVKNAAMRWGAEELVRLLSQSENFAVFFQKVTEKV